MDLPSLRHFKDGCIYSDSVEVLVGEAWLPAVLCRTDDGDLHWLTPDMATLSPVTEWRYGQEANQGGQEGSQGDEGIQSRNTAKRQARTRQGAKGQKPKAGDSNRAV